MTGKIPKDESDSGSKTPKNTTAFLQKTEVVRSISTPSDMLKRVVTRAKTSQKVRAPVHIWDFGGQHVFYTTHQAFLSARCIYLLVFDLSKDLSDTVAADEWVPGSNALKKIMEFSFDNFNHVKAVYTPYTAPVNVIHCQYKSYFPSYSVPDNMADQGRKRFVNTSDFEIDEKRMKLNSENTMKANNKCANILREKEFIAFWINSIIIFASSLKYPGTPKIIIVATHLDMIPKSRREERKSTIFGQIKEFFKDSPAFEHLIISEEFSLNSKDFNDAGYRLLRETIVQVASKEPFWREKRPTSWIPLEEHLLNIKAKCISIIEKSELEIINSISRFSTLPEEQLDIFLRFHHALGNILYFPDANLRSNIILDPRILITALKCLITAERFCRTKMSKQLRRQLSTGGMVSRENAFAIWEESENTELSEKKDHLLKIMEKLDLISRPKFYKDGEEHEIHRYYIPCMIEGEIEPKTCDYIFPKDLFSTLVLGHTHTFLPHAVFNKLIAVCISMWPLAKDSEKKNLLYSNFASFAIDSYHTMMLEYQVNCIKMTFKHSQQFQNINRTLSLRLMTFIISRMEDCFQNYTKSATFTTDREKPSSVVLKKLICCRDHPRCQTDLKKFTGNEKRPCQHHELEMRLDATCPWVKSKDVESNEDDIDDECGPDCSGVVDFEEEEPTDRDLGRLARRLNIATYTLGMGLSIPEEDVSAIKDNSRYGETEKKLRILQEWRERKSRRVQPTWHLLKADLKSMIENVRHKVCRIRQQTRIYPFLENIGDTPNSQQLNSLADLINPYKCFDLGIELGLLRSEIDQIRINHADNAVAQTRKVLSVWQRKATDSRSKPNEHVSLPTFLVLSNALDEVRIYNRVLQKAIEDNEW